MSDHFYPQSLSSLLKEILEQIENKVAILAIPMDALFIPSQYSGVKMKRYGQELATPFGVAAGPHSQLARNILSAWLMGARYIELKTIQHLDEIDVNKPCIDMQDEGYNCEWSQELKIKQSFDEYLNAWIIIHVLSHKFGYVQGPETLFNMSVGYDLKGIKKDNVQWYFDQMKDASEWIEKKKQEIILIYPEINDIHIPSQISNNITLSTMHGCPPEEVEQISRYLIEERQWHTTVKLNPTLLGAETLRNILNLELNYPIEVPDIAFEHDLKYKDALPMIKRLWELSEKYHLNFGVKLSNTLEVINKLGVLPQNMLYMSGRALHPISVNLAAKLQKEFQGTLDISFSAGADAYNLNHLVKSGLFPVTVSSDLLKPGGYSRLQQYTETLKSLEVDQSFMDKEEHANDKNKFQYLENYARKTIKDKRYRYSLFDSKNMKSERLLNTFDCIAAPCMDACPTEQDIPDYLYYTSLGQFDTALDIIYQKNPLPRTLGLVCEHTCQAKCTRVNYDESVRIRDIKEFVAKTGKVSELNPKKKNGIKVAIIGAGPSGLSAAWFLALEGCELEIFEKSHQPGGVPSSIIPEFRLNEKALKADIDRILKLGVKINYNRDMSSLDIKNLKESFDYIYLAAGAHKSRKLPIPGIENRRVQNPLQFLEKHKLKEEVEEYEQVVVIGGGNTAMDVARMAKKAQMGKGRVYLVYRRTLEQMPAEKQEILDAIAEGVEIKELWSPKEIISQDGKVFILFQAMNLSEKIGKDGRRGVEPVENQMLRIHADCIIPALGQVSIPLLETFNDIAHPNQWNASIKIFAGGDMARGGSSIVQAVADGKSFAEYILKNEELKLAGSNIEKEDKISSASHLKNRGVRIESDYPIITTGVTDHQAIVEASRCLQCDEYCNICVTVCPNRANQYYHLKAQIFKYTDIEVEDHSFTLSEPKSKAVHQTMQVYNMADFCNECGNCSTFCPSSGDPYKDKPQIHLSESSFEQSDVGYYYANEILFYKNINYKAKLIEASGKFIFEDDRVEVTLAEDHLQVLDVFIKEEGSYKVDLSLLVEMKIMKEHVFQIQVQSRA